MRLEEMEKKKFSKYKLTIVNVKCRYSEGARKGKKKEEVENVEI